MELKDFVSEKAINIVRIVAMLSILILAIYVSLVPNVFMLRHRESFFFF